MRVNGVHRQSWKHPTAILINVVHEREAIGKPIIISGGKVKKGVDGKALGLGICRVVGQEYCLKGCRGSSMCTAKPLT